MFVKTVGRSNTLLAQKPHTPKRISVAMDVGGWSGWVLKSIMKRYTGLIMGIDNATTRYSANARRSEMQAVADMYLY